jgi:predicted aldo/keto reductase-like oxidoreductase
MTTTAMKRVTFGSTNLSVSPLALGSSYGLSGKGVERAFDHGVNFMFWGLRRRDDFGRGVARIAKRDRENVVIAAQTYTRVASLMEGSVDRVLRALRVEYIDMLCLGWWDDVPPERILDAARMLRERGKTRHLMISCHHRPSFEKMIATAGIDAIMVRYNAAHPGAEREVFPFLAEKNPGVLAFTATRWATLVNPELTPPGEKTPTGGDCYRFVVSNPNVHASLSGPRSEAELDNAIAGIARGPMSPDELAWMRRVGAVIRDKSTSPGALDVLDRARKALTSSAHA